MPDARLVPLRSLPLVESPTWGGAQAQRACATTSSSLGSPTIAVRIQMSAADIASRTADQSGESSAARNARSSDNSINVHIEPFAEERLHDHLPGSARSEPCTRQRCPPPSGWRVARRRQNTNTRSASPSTGMFGLWVTKITCRLPLTACRALTTCRTRTHCQDCPRADRSEEAVRSASAGSAGSWCTAGPSTAASTP